MARIARAAYADMFGPTTGDRVRLADTDLIIEVDPSRIPSKIAAVINATASG